MEGPITFEAAAYIVGMIAAIIGLWVRIQQAMNRVRDELSEFKLEVAKDFIRSEHLQKMEERFLATEARTLTAIELLTRRIDRLIETMPKSARSRVSGAD